MNENVKRFKEVNLNCGEPKTPPFNSNGLEEIYYAVHIPSDVQIQEENEHTPNVFTDKFEALKLVKQYKKARFKVFTNQIEAIEFAIQGTKNISNSIGSVGEKSMPFRGPKSQELVKLRKAIEEGNAELVRATIWDNPRHLISIGDTPSILQEGSRYNALHVAAKAKNAIITELILNTVSNIDFIKLLYGDEFYQDADERAKIFLDLYLNTPDKGLNETPLHFAVKFGAVEVVEVLVSFPQCDRNLKNKYGHTPAMIICDRCEGASSALKHKIETLLEDNFYVPVLRSEDNCSIPIIGEPFSPNSPPNFNVNPLSPRMEIHAYAGPMKKEGAERFRRLWKTPPRSLKFATTENAGLLKKRDPDKGLERVGRELAVKYEVDWHEYWPFLDSFVDLASCEGLHLLEIHLKERGQRRNVFSKEGWSMRSPSTCNQLILSPVSDLCRNFEACTLSDKKMKAITNGNHMEATAEILLEAQLLKTELSPFLCVERACLVFAHRISTKILHHPETKDMNVFFLTQVKQLKALMISFIDDSRFLPVDFHLVHNRLGSLINCKLKHVLILIDEYDLMHKTLSGWLEEFSKKYDCFSSDDEGTNRPAKCTSNNKQVLCLLHYVLNSFTSDESVPMDVGTDEECFRVWSELKPCSCVWRAQNTRRTFTKKLNASNCRRLSDARVGDQCDISKLELTVNGQSEDNSSDDEFYTPPQSPTPSIQDEFEDCSLIDDDVFIDGNDATKIDAIAFNAVRFAGDKLNPDDYPNVYKWYHAISLYSEEERKSWTIPCIGRYRLNTLGSPLLPSRESPTHNFASPTFSNKSWLRITGENSPRKNGSRNLMNYF